MSSVVRINFDKAFFQAQLEVHLDRAGFTRMVAEQRIAAKKGLSFDDYLSDQFIHSPARLARAKRQVTAALACYFLRMSDYRDATTLVARHGPLSDFIDFADITVTIAGTPSTIEVAVAVLAHGGSA